MRGNQQDCMSTVIGLGFVAFLIIFLLSKLWFWENIIWFIGAGILAYILSPLFKNKENYQEIIAVNKPNLLLKQEESDEKPPEILTTVDLYFTESNVILYSKKKNINNSLRLFSSPIINIKQISITYKNSNFVGYVTIESKPNNLFELQTAQRQTPEEVAVELLLKIKDYENSRITKS